mgnify:FL=1
MNAKLSNFSELSNILSVKSSLRTNLIALFTRKIYLFVFVY